jgi:isocitrate dehydrogenase
VTVEAARAVARLGVGVKCATITATRTRSGVFAEEGLEEPNATIRAFLDGTVFRTPILVKISGLP